MSFDKKAVWEKLHEASQYRLAFMLPRHAALMAVYSANGRKFPTVPMERLSEEFVSEVVDLWNNGNRPEAVNKYAALVVHECAHLIFGV